MTPPSRVTSRFFRPGLAWAGTPLVALSMLLASAPPAAAQEPATLDSGPLRLEVTPNPYSYRLVEKKTGEVLLRSSGTSFKAGGSTFATVRAIGIKRTPKSLDADLILEDSPAAGHVRFSFATPEVLTVELSKTGTTPELVSEAFVDQNEQVYGLFEYPFGGKLDNRGLDRALIGVGREEGVWFASARAPFYLTSRKYGVYARTTALSHYTVGVGGKTGFSVDAPTLRYEVIYGPSYYDILARYTAIAGPPMMPPLWAFGSAWWSDDFNKTLHGAENSQENVLSIAAKLREHRIPASTMCLDRPYGSGHMGWGNMDFGEGWPDPKAMIKALNEGGMEVMVWSANRAWNRLYDHASKQNWLFPADTAVGPALDLRKPAAYSWLKKQHDFFVDLGVKGYKIDRGEQAEQPDFVQNENVTQFDKLLWEGMTAKHGGEVFSIARNVYDTGRRYTAVWNGDTPLTFQGLEYSVLTGLRSGMIVMPMWGSDTGGYVPSSDAPAEELFIRWFQFSAFSPIMEVVVGGKHTPWYDYSPKMVEVTREQASLHHDLIPYTRSFMYQATKTGAPIMRPLVFSYPEDKTTVGMWDQYLYGSEILVAPILQDKARKREVYLPAGRWLDYHDRKTVHAGGKKVNIEAPLERIPLLVREGAIVPRGDLLKGNNNWTKAWSPKLRVEVYPGAAGSNRFTYWDGKQAREITSRSQGGKMTVALPALGAPGTLEIYVEKAGKVTVNGQAVTAPAGYRWDEARGRLEVPFSGAVTVELEGESLFGPATAAADSAPAAPGAGKKKRVRRAGKRRPG